MNEEKNKQDKYYLEFTKEQILELYKFKQYMQGQCGVHYDNSSYSDLQDKGFLQDIINFSRWYWEKSSSTRIRDILGNYSDHLPHDIERLKIIQKGESK
ncbi:MAG: hypothetical protein ACTSPO_15185 [Candidatus Heimdallarchaeaceae archaeon]